ncbi:MAG: twin-arginine translocation signal domain-containing protein [Acidobacteriota bacterium]
MYVPELASPGARRRDVLGAAAAAGGGAGPAEPGPGPGSLQLAQDERPSGRGAQGPD